MGQIYLNGQPVDELPPEALKIMSERLGAVVSRYFTAHPDEYIRFLEGREKRRSLSVGKADSSPEVRA